MEHFWSGQAVTESLLVKRTFVDINYGNNLKLC